MRITNQMISNNSLRNLQASTGKINTLTEQLTTGKKIQRASEDPVIAIRALKLRTTVSQLTQYKNKNIEDAASWLDLTESSISNIEKRVEDIITYCTQGSTDSFSTKDRNAIADTIRSYKDLIYSEGGASYAGRFIFSGYKTETNLVFTKTEAPLYRYEITQKLSGADISAKKTVVNSVNPSDVDAYLDGTKSYDSDAYPQEETVYRLRLAYDNLTAGATPAISYKDKAGNITNLNVTTVMTAAQEAEYYKNVGDDEVRYIPATGEILFGSNVNMDVKEAVEISVTYKKEEFRENDLRPEHYFDCVQTLKSDPTKQIKFVAPDEGQKIEYEVNFNQKLVVNTEGRDLIKHDMGRTIEELAQHVSDVANVEETIRKLKAMLNDPQYSNDEDAITQINYMLEDANTELTMKTSQMQKFFERNISVFQSFQTDISALESDSGSRVSNLDLIRTRVSEQLINFTDVMSSNEEIDVETAAVDYSASNVVYNAALMTTGGVIKKTLLDFL